VAAADHAQFTGDSGRLEYRDRLLAVVLAQGAALHLIDRRHGVKISTSGASTRTIPGQPFRANRRETHADFGASELGRQLYDFSAAGTVERNRRMRWDSYTGRRVDFFVRVLPLPPGAKMRRIVAAVQDWLAAGAAAKTDSKPSAWFLAQRPVGVVDPERHRRRVIWRGHS